MSYRFDSIPTLETERTLLRQLFSSDANDIYLLRSNEKVNEFVERKKAESIEDGFKFINTIKNNADKGDTFYWAIILKERSLFAGTVTIWNIDKEKNKADIGYELMPAYWGKGIMKEVLQKVLEFAFTSLQLQTIEAWTIKNNLASIKLLEKFNFQRNAETESKLSVKESNYLVHYLNNPSGV